MSQFSYISSPNESWQDLVDWDDELYDPFFQGETSYTGAQGGSYVVDHQLSESYTSEPTYLVSAPPSVADGPPSLEYTVSAPPSILDGQSSYGQVNVTSLSFDTISTSPLAVQADSQYFGSFGACDNSLLSPLGTISDSPILDTRYERIPETFTSGSLESTTETVFNPHVTDSSHSFSGLDVRASRLFSNLGTWAEQPRIIEPIAEDDSGRAEVEPIAIPHPFSQSYNPALPSYRRSDGEYDLHSRSRAIAIPDATYGPTSYNNRPTVSTSARRAPPILSVSPVASRYPRSATLSRSASLSRRKTSTPSPSPDSYGWVSYHPNPLTHRLAPTSTEGMTGRAPKGRKRALTAEQRRHAALMRIVGACSNCQLRKERCDPSTPCRACLEHYKGDLANHPCRPPERESSQYETHKPPETRPSTRDRRPFDLAVVDAGSVEGFDSDSFLHVGAESTPFPIVDLGDFDPRAHAQLNSTTPAGPLPTYQRPDGEYVLHSRSRAIAIPDAIRESTSYKNRPPVSTSARRAPPMPSVSPVASHYPRSQHKTSTSSLSPDPHGRVSYNIMSDPPNSHSYPVTTAPDAAPHPHHGMSDQQGKLPSLMVDLPRASQSAPSLRYPSPLRETQHGAMPQIPAPVQMDASTPGLRHGQHSPLPGRSEEKGGFMQAAGAAGYMENSDKDCSSDRDSSGERERERRKASDERDRRDHPIERQERKSEWNFISSGYALPIASTYFPTFSSALYHQARTYRQAQMQQQQQQSDQIQIQQQDVMQLQSPSTPSPAMPMLTRPMLPSTNHALQDYQYRLRSLEQQNKKRLLISRQEQTDESEPPAKRARPTQSEEDAKQGLLLPPVASSSRLDPIIASVSTGSPGKNWMEIRSLSSSDNGWVDVDPGHGYHNSYHYSDSSATIFNPVQSLHIRTGSDVPRSLQSFSNFEEIQFPNYLPQTETDQTAADSFNILNRFREGTKTIPNPFETLEETTLLKKMLMNMDPATKKELLQLPDPQFCGTVQKYLQNVMQTQTGQSRTPPEASSTEQVSYGSAINEVAAPPPNSPRKTFPQPAMCRKSSQSPEATIHWSGSRSAAECFPLCDETERDDDGCCRQGTRMGSDTDEFPPGGAYNASLVHKEKEEPISRGPSGISPTGVSGPAINSKTRKRTKSGCLTCRKRRIRCGEERPTCANCTKSERQCEGYRQRVTFEPPVGDWPNYPPGVVSTIQHRTSMLPGTRTEIGNTLDSVDRDIVDVLLEQWTVPVY